MKYNFEYLYVTLVLGIQIRKTSWELSLITLDQYGQIVIICNVNICN